MESKSAKTERLPL